MAEKEKVEMVSIGTELVLACRKIVNCETDCAQLNGKESGGI